MLKGRFVGEAKVSDLKISGFHMDENLDLYYLSWRMSKENVGIVLAIV